MVLTIDDKYCIMGNIQETTTTHERTTMDTLLIISMTTTMAVVGMWLYSSFKWQGWGKI
jgi:hypothetical protein